MARTRRVLHPVAGQMFDISLVDSTKAIQRDPDALIEAVKAEDIEAAAEEQAYDAYVADLLELGAIDADEGASEEVAKATFSADDRKKLAASGEALPDGSFPIRNTADLKRAMRAYGRAKDKPTVMAHIRKRAKDLGAEDLLTPAFKSDAEASKATPPAISHEERDQKVNRALSRLSSNGNYLYAVEHHDDHVIAKDYDSGDTYKIPHTTDEDGNVTLGTPEKVRAQYEAAKAGAEFSAKNRDILSRIKGVLGRLLGEESQEPEHADIKSELEQAETLLEGKKAADSASTEEIEMTPEELTAALAAAVAPLAARLDAIEATKAAPVETPAPDAEAEKARVAAEAEAIEKARRVQPQAVAADAPRLTRHEDGAKELQEAAKAGRYDVTKLPTLAEGLRYLTNRDVRTGALADR